MTPETRELLRAQARADAARNPSRFERALTDGSRSVRRRVRRVDVAAIVGTVLAVVLSVGIATAARGADDAPRMTLLTVTPATTTLQPGASVQLAGVATFSDGTTETVTADASWESSDPTKVRIGDDPGLAVGVSVGPATITATFDGQTGHADVVVEPAPVTLISIAIGPHDTQLAVGETVALTATGTYSDDTTVSLTGDLTWTSSNDKVVSVDASGNARGLAGGRAAVNLDYQGQHASTDLTVIPVLKKRVVLERVTVDPPEGAPVLGQPIQFTATAHYSDGSTQDVTKEAIWASDQTKVINTPEAGLANVVDYGSATISATWQAVTGKLTVPVDPPPEPVTDVVVKPSETDLCQGKTDVQLSAEVTRGGRQTPATTQGSVSWKSANLSLATVDADGLVHMLTKDLGAKVTIVATSEGVGGEATITIVACKP